MPLLLLAGEGMVSEGGDHTFTSTFYLDRPSPLPTTTTTITTSSAGATAPAPLLLTSGGVQRCLVGLMHAHIYLRWTGVAQWGVVGRDGGGGGGV
ncbi:hypothetical protein CLOM_g16570 [Closterium sp. NIES-68]|nr:hypothetical protein CLOM_g16570 [Closterium sp. NIES-68]